MDDERKKLHTLFDKVTDGTATATDLSDLATLRKNPAHEASWLEWERIARVARSIGEQPLPPGFEDRLLKRIQDGGKPPSGGGPPSRGFLMIVTIAMSVVTVFFTLQQLRPLPGTTHASPTLPPATAATTASVTPASDARTDAIFGTVTNEDDREWTVSAHCTGDKTARDPAQTLTPKGTSTNSKGLHLGYHLRGTPDTITCTTTLGGLPAPCILTDTRPCSIHDGVLSNGQ